MKKAKAAVRQQQGIIIKSAREIELMRAAGRVVRRVHDRVAELIGPGVCTAMLNAEAEALIDEAGGDALFKGVENPKARYPFPAALCTSVNHELVHGVPNDRPLLEGDILSVDCGVRLGGYCGDAAVTLPVGRVSGSTQRLLDVTKRSLDVAVELIAPGLMWSEVASAIQKVVEQADMSVVRDFVGHGIGRDMHEEPKVPNFWNARQAGLDFELVPGLVLAVEPMVNAGSHRVEYGDQDGWAVVTSDGSLAAHFEHTIAVTSSGSDVLTDGR